MLLAPTNSWVLALRRRARQPHIILDGSRMWERMFVEEFIEREGRGAHEAAFSVLLLCLRAVEDLDDEPRTVAHVVAVRCVSVSVGQERPQIDEG